MKKEKNILELKPEKINYQENCPLHVQITTAGRSSVHMHESDIELVYCLSGSATIVCNHETVVISKGEVFTIDFQDVHYIFSDLDNCLIILHIDMKNVSLPWEYLEYVYFGCQDFFCNEHQQNSLQKVKDMILAAAFMYLRSNEDDKKNLPYAADNIINIMLNDFDMFNSLNTNKNTGKELHDRMHNIIKYCMQNRSSKLTISGLAQIFHINENYLSQFMRNSTYGSFRNMLGYIRGYEAQHLLLTTSLPVLTISHMCGFSDDKYFYKQFKLWWGKTPREYRNQIKEYIAQPVKMKDYTSDEALAMLMPHIADYLVANAFS